MYMRWRNQDKGIVFESWTTVKYNMLLNMTPFSLTKMPKKGKNLKKRKARHSKVVDVPVYGPMLCAGELGHLKLGPCLTFAKHINLKLA